MVLRCKSWSASAALFYFLFFFLLLSSAALVEAVAPETLVQREITPDGDI